MLLADSRHPLMSAFGKADQYDRTRDSSRAPASSNPSINDMDTQTQAN